MRTPRFTPPGSCGRPGGQFGPGPASDPRPRSAPGLLLLALLLACVSGCSWDQFNPFYKEQTALAPPSGPDSYILGAGGFVPDKTPIPPAVAADLAKARELFRREDYVKAEPIFHRLGDNDKNPPAVVQEALYYEAECLRLQGRFPKACDTYHALVDKFAFTPYRDQALRHMFDIANYWLGDTREQMRQYQEKREGKRSVVWPNFMHWDKTKPLLDEEGRAIEALDHVHLGDVRGPLSDAALFLAGTVKMYNEDYRDADHYFSQIVQGMQGKPQNLQSPWYDKAVEYSIYCKNMSTGGADYDARQVAEARRLVQQTLMTTPNLDPKKRKSLEDLLKGISCQQAEKDFNTADFYRRTGHPGSAYFYFEIVRRRYPGTTYATRAAEEMNKLRAELEKQQGGTPPAPAPQPPEKAPPPRPAGDPAPQQSEPAPPPRPLPTGLR